MQTVPLKFRSALYPISRFGILAGIRLSALRASSAWRGTRRLCPTRRHARHRESLAESVRGRVVGVLLDRRAADPSKALVQPIVVQYEFDRGGQVADVAGAHD